MTNTMDCFRIGILGMLLLMSGLFVGPIKAQFNPNSVPPFNELKAKAEAGDAIAQRQLALSFEQGAGVAKDPAKAAEWMLKSAQQGDMLAEFTMGLYYDNGIGVSRSMEQAVGWYRKAAEQGMVDAQFNLATCYHSGDGVPKDMAQAMFWYEKAASQGDDEARTALGVGYLNGNGVPKDPAKASGLLRIAAYKNIPEAKYYMGRMYRDGLGVVANETEATTWFGKAAESGHREGMFHYGLALHEGRGVGIDPSRAKIWIERAAKQGLPAAKEFLARNHPAADVATAAPTSVRASGTVSPIDTAVTNLPPAMPEQPRPSFVTQRVPGENSFASAPPGATVPSTPPPASSGSFSSEPVAPAGGLGMEPVSPSSPGSVTAANTPTIPGFSSEPVAPGAGNFASSPAASAPATPEGFTSFGDTGAGSKTPTSGSETDPGISGFKKILEEANRQGRASVFGTNVASSPDVTTESGSAGNPGSFSSAPSAPSIDNSSSFNSAPSSSAATGPTASAPASGGTPAPVTSAAVEPPAAGASELDALAQPGFPSVGAGQQTAFPVGLAYLTMLMAIAMVLISLMFFFTFKTRLHSLEGEIKKAQFELSKANVNLSSMMHQVEQLALQAPAEQTSPAQEVVSLPEWDEVKAQSEAQTFKISRPR